jgi:hypothetical protein
MLELDKEFKGFRTYLRSQGTYDEIAAILHRDFKFLGESGAYYFLWVVGENVPPYEEWLASRGE